MAGYQINRHAKWPLNTVFLKNNVKYDNRVKKLKWWVRRHNYKRINFPLWKVKVLKKLGRKYVYKFKKAPRYRKFYKQTKGYFNQMVRLLSFRNFSNFYWEKNFYTFLQDYKNAPRYKIFFYKQHLKDYVRSSFKIKLFRKKIIIRRIFAKRFGSANSNKKFYYVHKSFKNKRDALLRWINRVELRLANFLFHAGWARNIRHARFMVQDGRILLNGSKKHSTAYSTIRTGDNIALPKYLYRFKKRRFCKGNTFRFHFIDWYRNLNKKGPFHVSNRVIIKKLAKWRKAELLEMHKKFWNLRTLEWRLSAAKSLNNLSRFGREVKLFDNSFKKASISFYERFKSDSFLPLYKMHSFGINRKLIDFFLHSNYY